MTARAQRWILPVALLAALVVAAFLVAPLWQDPPAAPRTGAPDVGATASVTWTDPWIAPASVPTPQMRYDRFETFTREDGLPSDRVTTVRVEGETLYVGTDRGLAVGRPGRFRVFTTRDGLAHDYVTSVARDDVSGSLWISTLSGLSRLDGTTLTTYTGRTSGLSNDVVYHVVAADGLIWAATAAGTSCFDVKAGTWALYDHTNSIMHEPWCYALALVPGRTFVGVWGGGIVELDRATGRWREYRDPDGEMEIDLLRDDGPIHDVTSFVAYDAGVLWQSTYFGLSRYDGRRWRTYLREDTGLPGDFLNHVSARGHTAWLCSDQGFGVFDGTTCVTYRRREDGRCDVLTYEDGRPAGREILETAPGHDYVLWAVGGDSDVWLATGAGLTHGTAAREGSAR